MSKGSQRTRSATAIELGSRLRNAGDYLGALIKHEATASAALTGARQDLETQAEASRLFDRDYQAFLSSARTTWNYMIQAANAADTRGWLDSRLALALFEFHRALANQDLHDYPFIPGIQQKVNWTSKPGTPWVRTGLGTMPAEMVVTGFAGMRFHHEPKNLEPECSRLLEAVSREYGTTSVVELAARYFGGLEQVLKSGARRNRF